jgi:hypothetical protein
MSASFTPVKPGSFPGTFTIFFVIHKSPEVSYQNLNPCYCDSYILIDILFLKPYSAVKDIDVSS